MNRNRTILVIAAALAAAALPSCVRTENHGSAIAFSPVASKATKAIISGATYPEGESFAVSAYYNGSSAYFQNLVATKGTTYWETASTEYWPLSGTLEFLAYSPSSASGINITSSGISATDYTIQSAAAMQTDLCFAGATVTNCASHPESVPLTFSHALSQVVIRAKAADYYTTDSNTVSLALTSLSLSGIYSVADFSAGSWSNWESEYSYTISSTSTALTYNQNRQPETVELGSYLLLPQTLSANAALSLSYSITQSNLGTLTNPVVLNLGNSITEWLPGKKYIITLTVGMNDFITFTASAHDWAEENGGFVVE